MPVTVINLNTLSDPGFPEGAIYIGRAHAGRGLSGSKFANPFPLRDRNSSTERQAVLEQYHGWIWGKIQANDITVTDLQALDGHSLACFCAPQPCHGQVLAKAVEWSMDKTLDQDWTGVSNPIEMPRLRSLADWLKPRR